MLTTLKLLATSGLGAAYVGVAFLMVHPRPDSERDAHFLHRTASCWLPKALRAEAAQPPAVVEIGRLTYPEACRYLRLGWFPIDGFGAWTSDNVATLRLPRRPGARTVELTLRTAPAPNPAIQVRFAMNGQVTEDDVLPGTTKTVAFPLPPEGTPYDPDMQLHLFGHAVVPNPAPKPNQFPKGGTRNVGIGLVAIRYLPAQPEAAQGGKL